MQTSFIQKFKNFIHKLQAQLASWRYKYPQKKLIIIGVTGTDGKTTVTSMIYHILKKSGLSVGYISTVNAKIGEKELDTGLHVTTPDPWDVPKYLKLMVDNNVKFVVLESTSNGLQQNRLQGINYDSVVITNIKEDHLDYHGTWENYAAAKFKILEMTKDKGLAVLNLDDTKSAEWIAARSQLLTQEIFVKWCSINDITDVKSYITGISFKYLDTKFEMPIIGDHNYMNALQAINIALRYTELDEIQEALTSFTAPEGRMQVMQTEPFSVIVDFAHTPHALESALESLSTMQVSGGRIITVFGCAGQRDKARRQMGEVSASLSDITILTAEDPRDERLRDINDEIIAHTQSASGELVYRFLNSEDYGQVKFGMLRKSIEESLAGGRKPVIAFDEDSPSSRSDAIHLALRLAQPKDIVFITGKGHEKSLAFGGREYGWSDQDVVARILGEITEGEE